MQDSIQKTDTEPKLLDQVRGMIRLKHYSIRTEQAYVDWIKRFVLHFGKRHPRDWCGNRRTRFSEPRLKS